MSEPYDKDKTYSVGDKVTCEKQPRYRGPVSFKKVEGEENTFIAVEKRVTAKTPSKRATKGKTNTEVAGALLVALATSENGKEAVASFAKGVEVGNGDKIEIINTLIAGFEEAKQQIEKEEHERKAKLETLKSLNLDKNALHALIDQL